MVKINKAESCCSVGVADLTSCHVESILNIDERGQVVLPKDVREKAGVKPGDKLALISWEREGKICCLALIRADDITGKVKELLGPLMGNLK
jgi:antitoxin PrlF